MQERRQSRRVGVTLDLIVSSLFNQDNDKININSPIIVKDISRHGIGFVSKSTLPLNYYFNAALRIGNDESTLYSVVKIIRCEALNEDEYSYGCEFVGMAPVLDYIFDDLEKNNG
ncbi:MAG: PilZ domain-containing protein [Butyrivibrio sp.]